MCFGPKYLTRKRELARIRRRGPGKGMRKSDSLFLLNPWSRSHHAFFVLTILLIRPPPTRSPTAPYISCLLIYSSFVCELLFRDFQAAFSFSTYSTHTTSTISSLRAFEDELLLYSGPLLLSQRSYAKEERDDEARVVRLPMSSQSFDVTRQELGRQQTASIIYS